MNSANRKVDQSLSDFQTGLGATAHATLDTEQLISHLQVALVDTLSSLPEAEGDVIPVSEVCELLLQIHLQGVAASATLVAGVSLVTILQAGDWTRVSIPARHYFCTYITTMDQHQDSMQCAMLGLSE